MNNVEIMTEVPPLITPPELVLKVKRELQVRREEIAEIAMYDGPDPNPDKTQQLRNEIAMLDEVLGWIKDVEMAAHEKRFDAISA